MKKLDTSAIAPGVGFPVKKGTLDFLQQSYKDLFAELAQEIYPNLILEDFPSALRGCNFTVDGEGNYTMQPGAIFIPASILRTFPGQTNTQTGEIFFVPGVLTTPSDVSGGDYPALTLNIAYYSPEDGTADPVTFSDGSQHSVHQVRTLALTHGNHSSIENFICYLDFNHPVSPPNEIPNLLYPTPLSDYTLNGNLIKACDFPASKNVGQTAVLVSSITPSATLSSLTRKMTFTFNCELLTDAAGTIAITLVRINTSGTTVLRTIRQFLDSGVYGAYALVYVAEYTAGDEMQILAIADTGTTIIDASTFICECNDAM